MFRYIYCLFLIAVVLSACEKNESTNTPYVTTLPVEELGAYSASSGGKDIRTGTPITKKGVCWKVGAGYPTVDDETTNDGPGYEGYKSVLTGLQKKTTYSVRAYAINKYGVGYGSAVTFETPDAPDVDIISLSALDTHSVEAMVSISNVGNSHIDSAGVCVSKTRPLPDKTDKAFFFSYSGFATQYPVMLNYLVSNSDYYMRAFVITKTGATYYSPSRRIRTLKDYFVLDGKIYYTVQIGNQEWMATNLSTTRFRNGDAIPTSPWAVSGKPAYNAPYSSGEYVYNGYAVADSRKLAPNGWHIPRADEWETLIDHLGGADSACYKLKHSTANSEWYYGGNNQTGFGAYPFGLVIENRSLQDVSAAYFWTSTPLYYARMSGSSDNTLELLSGVAGNGNFFGYNVRCVKD